MYLRIRRTRFDELPDTVVAIATSIGAPKIQQTTGLHLTVVYVSGAQLTAFEDRLNQSAQEYASVGSSPEAQEILAGLGRCSELFVVSTAVELVVASDRSADEYEAIKGLYTNLLPHDAEFSDSCTMFVKGLQNLRA